MNGASGADWRRLEKTVTGRVLRPGDAGFRAAGSPFNTRYASTTPAGVVSVADHADVAHALGWARDTGVALVARSGGHSYAGYSVNTGLVIDLGALDTVSADGSTGLVTAGGGALMADVYAAINPTRWRSRWATAPRSASPASPSAAARPPPRARWDSPRTPSYGPPS